MRNLLRHFRRRGPDTAGDPLAIRNLLDDPNLRALTTTHDAATDAMTLEWSQVMAQGPIRFDRPALVETAT